MYPVQGDLRTDGQLFDVHQRQQLVEEIVACLPYADDYLLRQIHYIVVTQHNESQRRTCLTILAGIVLFLGSAAIVMFILK